MTPSMTYIEPTVLSPIDLLLDNDDTVGTDRIRAAFLRLSTAAQNHLGELAGFSEIQISVSESSRWMNIRFRLQTTGEADWTLMGQIIGRDRLRYAVAIQLQPRIMSRSDILAGGEMPACVMRDGWQALKPALQYLIGKAAAEVGIPGAAVS
ncbi:MAG: hypothetical protein HN650_06590 [Rhodospirillaceae bacterium]|nr:hypothetical protein [Rhodospirillaceae bacterium]